MASTHDGGSQWDDAPLSPSLTPTHSAACDQPLVYRSSPPVGSGKNTSQILILTNAPEPPAHDAQIVPGRKHHEHKHHGQSDAKTNLLRAIAQRLSPHRLNQIEQKVAAIEQRDRKKIDKPDAHQQPRRQIEQSNKADAGDLAGAPRDPDGTTELIGRFPAHDHIGKVGQRSRDDEIGLAHAQPERLDGPIALVLPIVLGGIAADADHALSGLVAETVGNLPAGRGGLEGQDAAVALDLEGQLAIGATADNPLHVGERLNLGAVDAEDQVAGLEARCLGGPARYQLIDAGGGDVHANDGKSQGEDGDRQKKIRHRPRRDNGRSRRQGFGLEGPGALLLAHARQRLARGRAGAVFIVHELDVTAKRHPGHAPARAMPIPKAEYFAAEADRKGLDAHPTPARDQKVPELVDENDDRQDEEEGDEDGEKPPQLLENPPERDAGTKADLQVS